MIKKALIVFFLATFSFNAFSKTDADYLNYFTKEAAIYYKKGEIESACSSLMGAVSASKIVSIDTEKYLEKVNKNYLLFNCKAYENERMNDVELSKSIADIKEKYSINEEKLSATLTQQKPAAAASQEQQAAAVASQEQQAAKVALQELHAAPVVNAPKEDEEKALMKKYGITDESQILGTILQNLDNLGCNGRSNSQVQQECATAGDIDRCIKIKCGH